ncbi:MULTISPECIES: DEAD/DEAH box helicase family protein [Legionella]|uniref:DEAD/DEAH box helicase family protein n=1 Tax=Legionella TaxID=445 RepID=UPI001041645C|nr:MULTISPECIES: DEAD/DEAH box helicase family protein [Legionella]
MEIRHSVSSLPFPKALSAVVKSWRETNYKSGITPTSRRLLEWWFIEEHLRDDIPFKFWKGQQEAIEHFIFCYEALGVKSLYQLAQQLDISIPLDPRQDKWPKFAFKMATGSGKTIVMAFAIIWSYFNAIRENEINFSKNFVLIASNLIVLDRLMGDANNPEFEDCHIFKKFPFIPPEWLADFQLDVIGPNEERLPSKSGVIYLTNWQKFIERKKFEPENPIQVLLGPKPTSLDDNISIIEKLSLLKNIMVLNDEAHHVWDEDLIWYKAIENIKKTSGLSCQLDFSATPKDQNGTYFPHIIYDYNLGMAIEDNIVKRPKIAELRNVPLISSKISYEKYKTQIDAGVSQWRTIFNNISKTGKKPILFVMTEDNKSADEVASYLETFPDLVDKILTIHSGRKKSEVAERELEAARKAAREIDSSDNPYHAIVSVLMLREGWDVKNVVVVVPLRSYSSKAQILPEQTLGRGLRRMWPELNNEQEQLIVIEHPQFHDLIDSELSQQGVKAQFFTLEEAYAPQETIHVLEEKTFFDIELPVLVGGFSHSIEGLSNLEVKQLDKHIFDYDSLQARDIILQKIDMLTKKLESKEILEFPYADQPQVYISSLAYAISKASKMPTHFHEIAPKVKDYVINCLFNIPISLDGLEVLKKLNHPKVRETIISIFVEAINKLVILEEIPILETKYKLSSEIKPFICSKKVIESNKTILNKTPVDNDLEAKFVNFLDAADDVKAFIKNEIRTMNLKISYISHDGYLRYYIPDFIVKYNNGMLVIETKGRIDLDVSLKDRQAERWAKEVSEKTKTSWRYLRINQNQFENSEYCYIGDFLI